MGCIHPAKVARGDARFDGLAQPAVHGAEVVLDDPGQMFAGAHHFALHQARVVRMAGDEVKIAVHVGQQLLAGQGTGGGGELDGDEQLAEQRLQHEAVQVRLAAEVVVEQGLVDPRRSGHLIGARACQATLGKNTLGRSDDAADGRRVLGLLETVGNPHPEPAKVLAGGKRR